VPTGLPEGFALYGSRGSLNGGTLAGDGGEREELAARFAREADAATRERFFPRGITDTFALAYLDWFRAIRAGGQPEMSGEEGLRDLATAYAILESSALGGAPVAVDAVLSGEVAAYQRPIDAHWGL
jgi:predicted dehydrogenase